jgi:hypothetical protein
MGMLFSRLLFRYWTGAVWWFNSAVEAPKVPAAKTGVQLEAGVVRGRTVGTSHLLLALDSGAVQLVNLLTHPHDLKVRGQAGNSLQLCCGSGSVRMGPKLSS